MQHHILMLYKYKYKYSFDFHIIANAQLTEVNFFQFTWLTSWEAPGEYSHHGVVMVFNHLAGSRCLIEPSGVDLS